MGSNTYLATGAKNYTGAGSDATVRKRGNGNCLRLASGDTDTGNSILCGRPVVDGGNLRISFSCCVCRAADDNLGAPNSNVNFFLISNTTALRRANTTNTKLNCTAGSRSNANDGTHRRNITRNILNVNLSHFNGFDARRTSNAGGHIANNSSYNR